MIGRGRRQSPFQRFRTFPRFYRRFCAPADALQHYVKEQQLRGAETKSAYAGNHVEIGELERVVGNTAWHARQSQEMLYEESQVEKEHGQPEMPFAQCFVIH